MKKLLGIIFAFSISINCSQAEGSLIKYFQTYTILDHNIREVAPLAQKEIEKVSDENTHKITTADYTWYYTNANNETYYIRFYPNNNNTNIFVVANEDYNKKNNDLINFCNKYKFKVGLTEDKEALREYKFDFYDLARANALGGFFISPDCIKPLKTGMKKLNDKMSKISKKNAVIPYSEDVNEINLTKVDTTNLIDKDAQINITVNEYRLKQKENKYVHAFEYLVKNTGSTTITEKTITCERLASTKDIATESFVDLDRLDLLDTVGTFPPVLIMTAGTSILCSVPNWVRFAKTTAETTRFAKSLPTNYAIQSGKTLRILVLKYKNNTRPLNFLFIRGEKEYKISF